MTVYFGFSTPTRLFLAADRRRIWGATGEIDDTHPKIHRVNDWLVVTGAGHVYLLDNHIAKAAPSILGPEALTLTALASLRSSLAANLRRSFDEILAASEPGGDPDLAVSTITFAGVASCSTPFSLTWGSATHAPANLELGAHTFILPTTALTPRATDPRARVTDRLRSALGTDPTPSECQAEFSKTLRSFANADSAVSPCGDLVTIDRAGTTSAFLG